MATGVQKNGTSGMDCPICMEIYKDPRALVCQHTFCLTCLDQYVLNSKKEAKRKNGIICPLCRTITKTEKRGLSPEEWAKELPPNYALHAVLESLRNNSGAGRKPYCQPCLFNGERKNASYFCPSCNEYQCETCVGIHTKCGFMKGHTMTALDERDNTTVDFKHLLYCHEHGKLIEFYCQKHKHLCCTTCAILEHKHCKTVELRNVTKKTCNSDVKRDMSNMIKKVQRCCTALTENEIAIEKDINNIEIRLKDIRKNVLERLDKFEREVREDLKIKKQFVKSENEAKRNESIWLSAALERLISTVDHIVQKGSHEVQFVTMEKLKQQCQIYSDSIKEHFDEAKEVRFDLNVNESFACFNDSSEKLGNVQVAVNILHPCNNTFSMQSLQCIDLKGQADRKKPLLSGLGFLSNGLTVMVDNTNDECLIMNAMFEHQSSCKLPYNPTCLAVLPTDEVLITAVTAIHSYNVHLNNALTHQTTIMVPFNLFSISEIDTDTFAVGCFNTNVPVCKVTRQGKVTKFVGDFPDIKYKINDSQCCFSKTNNILVVTFCKQNEIRIVDTKYESTTVVKDLHMIKDPRNVVFLGGCSGGFYVCSCDTHSIVHISLDGVILRSHKLADMQFPYMIAISNMKDKLLVSNSKKGKHKVMLFALNNEF